MKDNDHLVLMETKSFYLQISLHPNHIIENQSEPPLMAGFWVECCVSQVCCGQKLHGDRAVPVQRVHGGVWYSVELA